MILSRGWETARKIRRIADLSKSDVRPKLA